ASAARLARPRLDRRERPVAQDPEREGARERPAAEQAVQVVHAADGLPVRGHDDVARHDARLGRGAAALDPHHPDARVPRPPELPGLRATSLWMMPSIRRPEVARMVRPSALTTPADTVELKPSGLPIATTSWPTRSAAELPSSA